jgi:hypothetical protein
VAAPAGWRRPRAPSRPLAGHVLPRRRSIYARGLPSMPATPSSAQSPTSAHNESPTLVAETPPSPQSRPAISLLPRHPKKIAPFPTGFGFSPSHACARLPRRCSRGTSPDYPAPRCVNDQPFCRSDAFPVSNVAAAPAIRILPSDPNGSFFVAAIQEAKRIWEECACSNRLHIPRPGITAGRRADREGPHAAAPAVWRFGSSPSPNPQWTPRS